MKATTLDQIKARMGEVRERACWFGKKRRSDAELYQVLAECMALCEEVERCELLDKLKEDLLKTQVKDTRNRRYIQANADVYLVVGRVIFEDGDGGRRSACWRYSATLREAAKRRIDSADLARWLAQNGGVNTLFRGRPVQARTATTKTLHLNQAITALKREPFTVTLRRDDRGFYDVVEGPK